MIQNRVKTAVMALHMGFFPALKVCHWLLKVSVVHVSEHPHMDIVTHVTINV